MILSHARAASFSLLASVLLVGCGGHESSSAQARHAILDSYAKVVAATYEDTLIETRALDASIDQLLAAPTEATLATAREHWRAAHIVYGYSEAFRFTGGPIDADGLESRLNGWPIDENHIDSVVAATYNASPGLNIIGSVAAYPHIDGELIAQLHERGGEKNIASGFHAIEFLLWGQDLNDPADAPGQRTAADFLANGATSVTARRGQYLKATSTLLLQDLEALAQQWRDTPAPAQANYRREFVNGDSGAGLKAILAGIGSLAEAEMAGERMSAALLSGDQEDEQSCFSDTTAQDLNANVAGIEHVYFGRYQRLDGTLVQGASLADLVTSIDPSRATDVNSRISRTHQVVGEIRSPFDREILTGNPEGRARIEHAVAALKAEAEAFATVAALVSRPD
jgi:putative iron-regulated protein